MKKMLVGMVTLALAFAMTLGMTTAQEKAKHTIKEVMKVCMKGGLCGKVAKGEASADEKAKLVEMFSALGENKPPKGDAESWKEKTGALVAGAKAAAEGKGTDMLKKAANCKSCHDAHK